MRLLAFRSVFLVLLLPLGCGGEGAKGAEPPDAAADVALDSGDTASLETAPPPDVAVDVAPAVPGVRPPARPAVVASGGKVRWFALSKVQLGLTHRTTGSPGADAWKGYGYDLDGRTTSAEDSKTSTNTCKRRTGSPTRVLQDGDEGRDNNFGQHVMAVVKSLKSDAEESANQEILDGKQTLLLKLENVGPDDNANVPGALYLAGNLGKAPTFTEADKWPIDESSLDASKQPKARFPKGYMAGGVWVSGDLGADTFDVAVPGIGFGEAIYVKLQSGVVSFRVKDGSMGVIAGGSHADDLRASFTPAFKRMGICPGNATYEQIMETLTQAVDLVAGAPQMQDVTRTCDTLSIGLGFVVKPTSEPTVIVARPPPGPDDCG